jgi:mRNA-degrading endonuclease toxin of MazEF toxin-antitoxin module
MDKPRPIVVMLDALTLLPKDRFVQRIGLLSTERMAELCDALAIAVACGTPSGPATP